MFPPAGPSRAPLLLLLSTTGSASYVNTLDYFPFLFKNCNTAKIRLRLKSAQMCLRCYESAKCELRARARVRACLRNNPSVGQVVYLFFSLRDVLLKYRGADGTSRAHFQTLHGDLLKT